MHLSVIIVCPFVIIVCSHGPMSPYPINSLIQLDTFHFCDAGLRKLRNLCYPMLATRMSSIWSQSCRIDWSIGSHAKSCCSNDALKNVIFIIGITQTPAPPLQVKKTCIVSTCGKLPVVMELLMPRVPLGPWMKSSSSPALASLEPPPPPPPPLRKEKPLTTYNGKGAPDARTVPSGPWMKSLSSSSPASLEPLPPPLPK